MELANAAKRWRTSWYLALAAGGCGVVLPVLSWLVLGKPYWWMLLSGDIGGTIYPSSSVLPQNRPGVDESIRELLVVAVCGGLFLAGWLRAWRYRRRTVAPGSVRWFWWSLLLLLPLGGQVGGISYAFCLLRKAEVSLQQEFQQLPLRSAPTDSSKRSEQ